MEYNMRYKEIKELYGSDLRHISGPYKHSEGRERVILTFNDGSTKSVLYYRLLVEVHTGERLSDEHVVHHIDGDCSNNSIDNLQVMTRADHILLHIHEHFPAHEVGEIKCDQCGESFEIKSPHSKRKFCSASCHKKSTEKFDISKEVLQDLVWEIPTSSIAKMFGVSDNAISNRCKKYGIEKPGRGYWRKKRTGNL